MNTEEEQDCAAIVGLVERMDATNDARRREPYDGLLGELPEWFPEWDRDEFLRLRNNLLDEIYPWVRENMTELDPMVITRKLSAVVKTWIEAYRSASDASRGWPERYEQTIGTLARYYSAFLRGPQAGERFALGDKHATTMGAGRQATTFRKLAGKARAGKHGLVRQVVERLKPKNLDDLLGQLESDAGQDLLASVSRGPLAFEVQEVDIDDEVVRYLSEGQELEVKFKTLKNHIARIK